MSESAIEASDNPKPPPKHVHHSLCCRCQKRKALYHSTYTYRGTRVLLALCRGCLTTEERVEIAEGKDTAPVPLTNGK